jgi:hypothetical protein
MKNRVLWQLQLSATNNGKFSLSMDSNWNVFLSKAQQMLRIDPTLRIDVLVPYHESCVEDVVQAIIDADIPCGVTPIEIPIITNALITRYDFPWEDIMRRIGHRLDTYTHVYINDPMQLRNWRALWHSLRPNGPAPRFILQTHFLDTPGARVVPEEVSYWHGTVEACTKADVCVWHCDSMRDTFELAVHADYQKHVHQDIMAKSMVWKSGYSIDEIRRPIRTSQIRFNSSTLADDKVLVWVPNRVGGLGKSLDYTNNGKFLFDVVPELFKQRQDFVVVAGNPNQKISNDEIAQRCPAYVKLVDGTFNRDEYRYLSSCADIVVGLYTNDTNGGLASLEAIELGAVPLFPAVYEYETYFRKSGWARNLCVAPDLSDTCEVLSRLIDRVKDGSFEYEPFSSRRTTYARSKQVMQKYIRETAAYENTTRQAMISMGLL